MKNRMTVLGLMVCAAVMTGTGAFAAEEPEKMTGAYERYIEEGVPAEAQEAFDAAMKDFMNGENYTALQLVETQLVAGMNYRILAEVSLEEGQTELYLLTIYQDLEGNCEVNSEQKVIAPENQAITVEETDFATKASFNADDVNWDDQTLRFDMYQDALYDMVDLTRMECGSVVAVDGLYITVETIDESEATRVSEDGAEEAVSVRTINKEMGSETVFVANEGGTWISVGPDDLISDMKVGEGTYPISDQCVLTDVGESPSEKVEVPFAELQSYLTENKAAMGNSFTSYNTFIEVEDGKIVSIERTYRP